MKQCNTCKETLSLEKYSKDKRQKDGRQGKCKSCSKIANKQWHVENPNYMKKKGKQYYIDNKEIRKEYHKEYNKQRYNNNLQEFKERSEEYNKSEGEGIYNVMLDDTCLYVGEGQLKQRKAKHLVRDPKDSKVGRYCTEHNINRKLLSFNVLGYEDDKRRREEIETHYITYFKPLINSKKTSYV